MSITCHSCNVIGCEDCIRTVCCDCGVRMCRRCKNDHNVLCGCYGSCLGCGTDVNRGENGWPCYVCDKWLCFNCQIKDDNDCKECGNNEADDIVN